MNRTCESCEMQRCMMRSPMVTDCSRHKPKPKPNTNADRIRAMSDEELAAWLMALKFGPLTPWCDFRCEVEYGHSCEKCIPDWLRQPVKDGDNG